MKSLIYFLTSLFLSLQLIAADPVISEFMADNDSFLADSDGDYSDWIEIHNPDTVSVNLEGWYLTDSASQLTKWRFPNVAIPPKGFMVVFASSKNRTTPGLPLHTNFSLSANGEFLALIKPDGITASTSFSPSYPAQEENISYGTSSTNTSTTLISQSTIGKRIVPTSLVPDSTWKDTSFSDTTWTSFIQGAGYDTVTTPTNFLPEIGRSGNTQGAMRTINASCYIRIPFTVTNPASFTALNLRMKYDDGFAIYLNGSPINLLGSHLKKNAPATLEWNSLATAERDNPSAIIYENFGISENLPLLVTGANVLAIHGLNRALNSDDFLQRAELTALAPNGSSPSTGKFNTPTPGTENSAASNILLTQTVTFSHASGTYPANFTFTMSGAQAGQVIRYTTNGSLPTTSSTLYSSGINITTNRWFRAAVFDSTTGARGPVNSVHLERIDASLSNYNATSQPFKSALPIVVLNRISASGEVPNDNIAYNCRMQIIDRDNSGYSSITATPALASPIQIKIRGSSSAGFPKKSYGIELRNDADAEVSASILGMPAGEDWALISCYDFDRAFMRNAWIYEMHRRTGRWSPRTRLVEVFFNQDINSLQYSDYRGVYVLCELIREDGDRLDITGIDPTDTANPQLTGGYIFKVDRNDTDEYAWSTTRGLPTSFNLVMFRPKLAFFPQAQITYFKDYFQAFENQLFTENSNNFTTRNYNNYINADSFIDHHLFNTFAKNVDALRLSAYYYKDRGRKMDGGPLWDFDRSANSTDGRDDSYNTWVGTGDATQFFNYAWWDWLFNDVDFSQKYVDRWQSLRRSTITNPQINSLMDSYLAEFKTADVPNPSTRDYTLWYGGVGNITTETANLKTWLNNRANWIDSQFCTAPTISPAAGAVNAGTTITITVPSGTTVYYTTNGTDPRLSGGGISGSATLYTAPFTVSSTTTVIARARRTGTFTKPATNWSGPMNHLYRINENLASASSLRVTAIHYNPLGPDLTERTAQPANGTDDYEWIELTNISANTINLAGVKFLANAPFNELTLPSRTLASGEKALVVKYTPTFTQRYGSSAATKIIAEWSSGTGLNNDGETVTILAADDSTIASFTFDDDGLWPGRSDGKGSALEYIGTSQLTVDYNNPANWRSSIRVHGTPGDTQISSNSGIVINEVLTNSSLPYVDSIELHNTTASPINIGNWFISPSSTPETADDFRMFRIPANTTIPANGYLTFTEVDFNPNGSWNPSPGTILSTHFSLDGHNGGTLWLISADAAQKLINYEEKFDYGSAQPNVPIGRYPNATGSIMPLASQTLLDNTSATTPRPGLGAENTTARLGTLQTSEIMYHPLTGQHEYIEVVNITSSPLNLTDASLRGNVDYYFSPGTTLASGESIIIVSFNPTTDTAQAATLRSNYNIPLSVRLFGPWRTGTTLDNSAGQVRLYRPVPPPVDQPSLIVSMLEDEVLYQNSAPWPTTANGTGSAIHRLGINRFGNDPSAWYAIAANPGTESGGWHGFQQQFWPGGSAQNTENSDPDNDTIPNLVEYLTGTSPLAFNTFTHSAASNKLSLNYTLRLDRTDRSLRAETSSTLQNDWLPANDDLINTSGLFQTRQAWVPIDSTPRKFLRLFAE